MPKSSPHSLIWSEKRQYYELHTHGQQVHYFRRGDESAFSRWLAEHTAFAFVGQSGRISVLKENRLRGTAYWYAYSTRARHARKRYLGCSDRVTFARLELEAKVLASSPSPISLASGPPSHEIVAPPLLREEAEQEGSWPNTTPPDKPWGVLLSTKLSPPRLPPSLVKRSRLLSDLEAVLAHPLTLISAPAGSGKTTLLSAWVAVSKKLQANEGMETGAKPAFAWLSLDILDNDPIRFWASVIAALRICLPTIGETALALLHMPQSPPLSTILATLLNELLEEEQELILILDDYYVIEDPAIHETMLFLLDYLPPTLHLVLATRIDPALPLSRLRVRDQLLEIRGSDLRFTSVETSSFLIQGMGLPLSEEDVTTLEHRTEGWIAGLQLAALSLRKREDLSTFVKNFAGSHRFVLDYIQQDILARLSDQLQDFVLQTSILTCMHAALCQAVTLLPTLSSSQEMLETLERVNLFVVPLDEQRQWYRFHDLFREALRARLQASQPERMPLLHIRAAHWYEATGEWREAIAHALAAPDYQYAASLMEQAALHFWLSGEVRTVQNWVQALPDTVLCVHARLALNATLRLINSINLSNETLYASLQTPMEHICTRMEGILCRKQEFSLSEAEAAWIGRRLRLLRALIEARSLLKRGDKERLHHLSQEIEALPQDEEVNWSIIPLTLIFWLQVYLQGEGTALIPRLLSMKQLMIEAGDHLATIRVRTMLAHVYTQAAQWHRAKLECLETLSLIEQSGMYTIWSGYLYYNQLILSYACNELEEASDWLQRLRRSAQDWQQVELLVRWEICSARLALVRGDLSTTQEALHNLEALVELEGYAYHAPWVICLRVQLWLAEANLIEASEWAVQAVFHPKAWDPLRKGEFLMLVQVFLAQQRYSQAIEMLSRFSEHLDLPGDIRTTIEFLVLQVMALHATGLIEEMLRVAARLLALTEPEGSIRVYLDAGEPMKQVLKTLLAAPHDSDFAISISYVSLLLATFQREESGPLRIPLRGGTPLAHMQEILSQPLQTKVQLECVEPLSPQELRVLRLLVAGWTYAEMAETLIVSPNTVKTQVSSIYRKLGVSRRAEAVAVTARLHLL